MRFWRVNVVFSYLEICIHIFGYGKLKRTLRAFICTTGDLRRRLRATQASDQDPPCDEMVKKLSFL